MTEEFYIGWQQKAPGRTAKACRVVALGLVIFALFSGAAVAISQHLIGRSVYEWGHVKEFTGVLRASPVPHLVSARGGTNQFHYLVRPWKFGFDPKLAASLNEQEVTLRGTLIHRDDQAMIEVSALVRRNTNGVPFVGAEVSHGDRTFIGEIVDSKCFLGVMNPGQLKPHRACAVRCISGGVPPVLLVRQNDGTARYLLLVSRDGKPINREILSIVAEPVRITGELVRAGEILTLRVDAAKFQRLP
jgi:hypothetical protein